MSTLRIALAQTNSTVGDLDANAVNILEWATQASMVGADVIAFGQQVLTGHPVEGLTQRTEFVEAVAQRVERLAGELDDAGLGDRVVIVGYVVPGASSSATSDVAGAAVIQGGAVVAQTGEDASGSVTVRVNDIPVSVAVSDTPVPVSDTGVIIRTVAAPFVYGQPDLASSLTAEAVHAAVPVAGVNLSGAQDGIVFGGDSAIVDASGEVVAQGNPFGQELVIADVEPAATVSEAGARLSVPPRRPGGAQEAGTRPVRGDDKLGQLWDALTLGIADYADKNGFASVMLGLSGGMDSALVAVLAADAIGAHRVHTVSMPSRNSSPHSKTDAEELAGRLGTVYSVEPIQPIVDTYLTQLAVSGLAVENLQARVRGVILMTLSNQDGHLVLSPGNRSEAAVGYATLYGDMVGGYAPIADVPKTLVYELARWRNDHARQQGHTAPIPDSIIDKAPSAELAPGQVDTDSLPEYEVLDPIIAGYLDDGLSPQALVDRGHERALVQRVVAMIGRGEYKRRQGAPFTRILPWAHRTNALLPITNRFR